MEFIPLATAAAIAYRRLTASARSTTPEGVLDAAAEALAILIPLYAGLPPRRLSEAELHRARFRRGASVLRLHGGGMLEQLSVRRRDLEAAVERLMPAGLRFSEVRCEGAPRRLPTVMPA